MQESELRKMILTQTMLPQAPDEIVDRIEDFREYMVLYNSAIREVTTKLEILNDELSLRQSKNPIQFIKSRVKKPTSIINKLQRLEQDINVESVTSLNDVAGIRVIASFIDDVYDIAEMLVKQDDIKLVRVKDYIKNPKPNGYRSYHMIIEVPVYFSDKKEFVKVEIQIRTVAMDFWASLEHQLRYKKNVENAESIEAELKAFDKKVEDSKESVPNLAEERSKISDKKDKYQSMLDQLRN